VKDQITPSMRAVVKERADNECEICGRPGEEIDHKSGILNDPDNLQLLCKKCHHRKTATEPCPEFVDFKMLMEKLDSRIKEPVPLRLCDDYERWPSERRERERERKLRLLLDVGDIELEDLLDEVWLTEEEESAALAPGCGEFDPDDPPSYADPEEIEHAAYTERLGVDEASWD
jgi:hypothetical protein